MNILNITLIMLLNVFKSLWFLITLKIYTYINYLQLKLHHNNVEQANLISIDSFISELIDKHNIKTKNGD